MAINSNTVKSLFSYEVGDLTVPIQAAQIIVDLKFTAYESTQADLMGAYLAAHFYVMSDGGQYDWLKDKDFSVSYANSHLGKKLNATNYGQTLLMLDNKGTMQEESDDVIFLFENVI